MAKWANDNMMDAALNYIKDNTLKISVCSAQPSNVSEADTAGTYMLAVTTCSTGDFTVGNGDVSGRKVAVAQKASITISSTGVASHVALYSTVSGDLYYVTTCSTQALTSTANTVTIPTWDIEIADPS